MHMDPNGRGPGPDLSRSSGNFVDRWIFLVRKFPLFADIASSDCASIVAVGRETLFARRQTIFIKDEPAERIFLLTSGFAKVTQFGANGGEVILRLSSPGELLGVFGASSEGKHQSTAKALKAATTLVWDTRTFEMLSERFPTLRRNLARILSGRLQEMEERYREISTEKVASRLCSQLIRLHSQIGQPQTDGVEVTLSQHELAQLTGTTLFTVSRQLSQWEQQGILRTRREAVVICNLPALMELSANE
jgi:CRP-like cAMP-binding protein